MGSGDSKLEFKSRLNSLAKQVIRPSDHKFWAALYVAPLTAEDVFALVTPDDVRGLREEQPENLSTIIFKVGVYTLSFAHC
jgi:hypothetical protein